MFKRIFLDTNPIIYFLENEQPYAGVVRDFLADAIMDEAEFYTSTITDAEYLVRPIKLLMLKELQVTVHFCGI